MKPQYTTEARNVVFTPDINIHATFKGGLTYAGELGKLRDWAINNKVDAPLSCFTELGRHGLFPCIVANNEKIAAGLSVMMGAKIEEGNGATFASRTQMRAHAAALSRAGIKLDYASFQWGITEQAYANDKSANPTAQRLLPLGQPTIEEQLADSPF